MINVVINGRPRTLDADTSIPDLVRLLDITHPRIAVAVNGTVLRREEHEATMVHDGDTVEIVRMVGGG